MAAENASKYPEILRDLADKTAEMLSQEGIEHDKARTLGWAVAELIRREWGGQAPYIPKGQEYYLSQRDREIYRRFNGTNLFQLCREFGITKQRLYQIIAAIREEETRRRQGVLF